MLELVRRIERWITLVLIAMLAVVVVLATGELGYTIFEDIAAPPVLFPGIEKLLDLFGKTLLVVIGIELVETLRVFAAHRVVRVEIVLTVAMIALARKIIILEVGRVSSVDMLAIAALVAALALAYRAYTGGPGGLRPRRRPGRGHVAVSDEDRRPSRL